MATTTEQPVGLESSESISPESPRRRGPAAQSSWRMKWLLAAGVTVLLAILVITLFPGLVGYASSDESRDASTEKVKRDRLLVTVTEDGNLESSSNVEVRCQVAGGGTIIWIIPDGSMVEEGQDLVHLDQSVIQDQLNTQRINYEKAVATRIQADQDFAAASIAVKEYDQGTYLKDLQSAESQIKIAMENLRSCENTLTHTERMFRKGFVTALQLEADKFSVERSKLDLDAAQTSKKVLTDFTRPKTLKSLQATRDAAEARTRSEKAALQLEKDKLDRLQNQLKYSIVKAPQRGMVIYANEAAGRRGFTGNQNSTIEEGGVVRERQTLIRLPDLTKMQVKVTVHESKVDMIRPGMPARITVQDRQYTGKVISVANQPEAGNWFMSSIKEYATIVSIEGETTGLKPGMTSIVEILVADLHDVMTAPVSAVVEQNGKFYGWVKSLKGPQRRPLLLGQTNDKVVEVRDGLKEGEEVILNPRAAVLEAQQGGSSFAEVENADRFGNAKFEPAGSDAKSPTPDAGAKGASKSVGGAESKGASAARTESGAPRGEGQRGGDAAGARSADGRRNGQGGRRGGGGRRPDFATLDKNKDGKLTEDEMPERMKSFFGSLDTNKDGAIDAKEWAEMQKRFEAMRRQRQSQGGGAPGGGAPSDGGGAP